MVGKTAPSEFDMPELNGYYHPMEAVDICDSNPVCAGFTYRGLMNATDFPEVEYDIRFVRFLAFVDMDPYFSNWVTYKAIKQFAEYPGTFSGFVEHVFEEES